MRCPSLLGLGLLLAMVGLATFWGVAVAGQNIAEQNMSEIQPAPGKGNQDNTEGKEGAENDADGGIALNIAAAGNKLNKNGCQQAEQ